MQDTNAKVHSFMTVKRTLGARKLVDIQLLGATMFEEMDIGIIARLAQQVCKTRY